MSHALTKLKRIVIMMLLVVILSIGLLGASAYSVFVDETERDMPSRGDTPPGYTVGLPYQGGSGGIRNYTFTDANFYPTSTKKIRVSINGYVARESNVPTTCTAYLKLYNCTTLGYTTAASTSMNLSEKYFQGTWEDLSASTKYAGHLSKSTTSPNNKLNHDGVYCRGVS